MEPTSGDTKRWSIFTLITGAGQLALGIYNTSVRSAGRCREINPAYTTSCPGRGLITTQYLTGGLGLLGTVAFWPKGTAAPKVVGHYPDHTVTIEVQNNSSLLLRVTLEGAGREVAQIRPGETVVMRPPPGRYQQTVEAVGGNYTPYIALQTYAPGTAYRETYFVKPRGT